MPINENSKPITKNDDAAKDFIRQSLRDQNTRGFDVDSIYCEVTNSRIKWTIFELLKCDTVEPQDSHPRRYWNGKSSNKRKFLSLWTLCMCLRKNNMDSRLLLVNYRDVNLKIKVMQVESADENTIITRDRIMTFQEWSIWFQGFNKNKEGATWDAIKLISESGEEKDQL